MSNSEEETQQLAVNLSKTLEHGDILLLNGTLGAGKTVFSRALLRSLAKNSDLDVPSPTYTLLQAYDTPKGHISHFDLYRLENPEEIYELGWEDAISDGITIVEWPERLGHLKPTKYTNITIETIKNAPNSRKIGITKHETR